jgi:dTDP-4-dehydrorhamnose reductase
LGELYAFDKLEKNYCADLGNLAGLAATIRAIQPQVIVNAAAYTAVDKAETDIDQARLINAAAPGVLAEEAKRCGAVLAHYSTDYVFDGGGNTPKREIDPVNPLNVYGLTKLEGEQAIQASGCRYLIFRTSWVYAARWNNFPKIILRLAQERHQLTVINDQFGAPTGAELLADVSAHAIRKTCQQPDLSGVYHLCAAGETCWYDYAHFVLDFARNLGIDLKTPKEAVKPIPTSDYPTPAKRPLNSRLNTSKLETAFDMRLPVWQSGVERLLTEIYGK